jgi:hypothetical protein
MVITIPICSVYVQIIVYCTLFQKLRGGAGSKRYGMDFSLSHEGKEENPRNYNGLRVRERKNTFHITLNQRQLLSIRTVYRHTCNRVKTCEHTESYNTSTG